MTTSGRTSTAIREGAPTRQTARDLVANYVRRAIVAGELAPSAKLNVADFADIVGVSQTPTREAFQLLAAEGLVKISPYRGARVADLSAEEYQEIFLMRVGLEGLAARLGAQRIDDAGIARMGELIEQLAQASKDDDVDTFLEVDRAFHEVHYRASGRESLWERIISLRRAAERYTRVAYRLPKGGMRDTVKTHRDLYEAVRDRDSARAERIIKSDLKRTYESFARELRGNPSLAAAE